jgi:hypothetical protein
MINCKVCGSGDGPFSKEYANVCLEELKKTTETRILVHYGEGRLITQV